VYELRSDLGRSKKREPEMSSCAAMQPLLMPAMESGEAGVRPCSLGNSLHDVKEPSWRGDSCAERHEAAGPAFIMAMAMAMALSTSRISQAPESSWLGHTIWDGVPQSPALLPTGRAMDDGGVANA